MGRVLIVRATKKLRDRIGPPSLDGDERSTTVLGEWYATALFWKPQVALFVNEPTLLPVLLPLAPAATLLARFPQQAAAVLAAHGAPDAIISEELRQMRDQPAVQCDPPVIGRAVGAAILLGARRGTPIAGAIAAGVPHVRDPWMV
jgi:hypothetical protein